MFDAKVLRNQPDLVKAVMARKGISGDVVDRFLSLDARRRELIKQGDELKALRNKTSEDIARVKKAGGDIAAESARMREVGEQIKGIDKEFETLDVETRGILEMLPNMPHESVPDGAGAEDNVEVRRWGQPREYSFKPRPHWEIGESLDVIDFQRATKLSGSRFVLMKGMGAQLERALINFMIDLHTSQHGYHEVLPPYLVNAATMYGTGQLPKFEADLFKTVEPEMYLIPTSEVPLTNMHRDEILELSDLPRYYCGFSACFRSEAGAAGRDTRGMIRVHQFQKVELVKFAKPDESYVELEKMVQNAERVLQLLEIPHRTMLLCRGDMGFSASKTYDLEFWSPGQDRWIEISSCSNCGDFQARRAEIRYRPAQKAKPELVHTLNGSGLAVGRTVAAVLETYQEEDGTVRVPEVLRPYIRGADRIGKVPATV